MKLLWSRRASYAKVAPHPANPSIAGIAQDFLRMIAAAIAAGLVISMVAATLAMLLSRTAEAAPATAPTANLAGPGILAAGMGCDSVPIEALERDWWVKIEGRRAVVRVMQSFLLPEDSEGAAVFSAFLPGKAVLQSLNLQTTQAEYAARIMTRNESDAIEADAYRTLTRQSLIVTTDAQGEISTSLLPGLEESRVVTIAYAYAIPVEFTGGKAHLALPLTETRFSSLDASMETGAIAAREPSRGSVWVEWTGSLPRRVDGAPTGAHFEREAGRIEALSWESLHLSPGARFHLSWSA